MKTLKDGTNVRAILWYLALEYKDSLLQKGVPVKPLHDTTFEEFREFCSEALHHFLEEAQENPSPVKESHVHESTNESKV